MKELLIPSERISLPPIPKHWEGNGGEGVEDAEKREGGRESEEMVERGKGMEISRLTKLKF